MIKIIRNAPKNVAAFEASGSVTKSDFEIVFRRVKKVIEKEGELNYLLSLKTDISEFSMGAWLKDLMLGVKHLGKWNRCAIISDSKAIDLATKAMNSFTIGEFKVFSHSRYDDAMHWVSKKESETPGSWGSALLAGLGGAIALNVIHEALRKTSDNVPEVNKVGEEALEKTLAKADTKIEGNQLYSATLAADVVSNGLYYAALATNKVGVLSGIAGGIGAIVLPKYMGLDDAPVASTGKKKVMTVAYYTIGAAVTSLLYSRLKKK